MSKPVYQWILYALLVLFVAGCGGTTSPDDGSGAGQNGSGGGNGGITNPDTGNSGNGGTGTDNGDTPTSPGGDNNNSGGGTGNTGGGDNNSNGGGGGPGGTVNVAAVQLLAESPNLPSAVTLPIPRQVTNGKPSKTGIRIRAVPSDKNSHPLPDATVSFSAPASDDIYLANPNKNNHSVWLFNKARHYKERKINITAESGGQESSVSLHVTGTQLKLSGPSVIASGGSATYVATLVDSAGNPIPRKTINITPASSIKAKTLETNDTGRVKFTLVANNPSIQQYRVTVSTLDGTETAEKEVNVQDITFKLIFTNEKSTNPIKEKIDTNNKHYLKIKLLWLDENGNPVKKKSGKFHVSRGRFVTAKKQVSTFKTSRNGTATAKIKSEYAGSTVVTATAKNGSLQSTRRVEFVATKPHSLTLKANPKEIRTDGTTTITAVVRDDKDNPVPDVPVSFHLTGPGRLISALTRTDENGKAQTVVVATGKKGTVKVYATVPELTKNPNVTIHIGDKPLYITLGTGHTLQLIKEGTTYSLNYAVMVTDASGNPISGNKVYLNVVPVKYSTGTKTAVSTDKDKKPEKWNFKTTAKCSAEDVNHDGFMQRGEDNNTNGQLDPGISVQAPDHVVIQDSGITVFQLKYPKNYAGWIKVRLTASSKVAGSENTAKVTFELPHQTVPTVPSGTKYPSPLGKKAGC